MGREAFLPDKKIRASSSAARAPKEGSPEPQPGDVVGELEPPDESAPLTFELAPQRPWRPLSYYEDQAAHVFKPKP
jgi:hypothetical protein